MILTTICRLTQICKYLLPVSNLRTLTLTSTNKKCPNTRHLGLVGYLPVPNISLSQMNLLNGKCFGTIIKVFLEGMFLSGTLFTQTFSERGPPLTNPLENNVYMGTGQVLNPYIYIKYKIEQTTLKRAFCPLRFQFGLAFVMYTIRFQLLKQPHPHPLDKSKLGRQ